MALTLTENAAEKVREIREAQKVEPDLHLRVGITAGGCSGFSYSLTFDKDFDETKDSKYEQHGVEYIVDKKSALYLDGTTVDFYNGLEKQGFTFNNPNEKGRCGCGESFHV